MPNPLYRQHVISISDLTTEQRGGNPFIEITVPEAGIKLIQAVGRLIRTEQDYGRVTILDNRVKTQRYGQQLLASLPPFKRIG